MKNKSIFCDIEFQIAISQKFQIKNLFLNAKKYCFNEYLLGTFFLPYHQLKGSVTPAVDIDPCSAYIDLIFKEERLDTGPLRQYPLVTFNPLSMEGKKG